MNNTCEVCKGPTLIMCYKGTGICSEQCRKIKERGGNRSSSEGVGGTQPNVEGDLIEPEGSSESSGEDKLDSYRNSEKALAV